MKKLRTHIANYCLVNPPSATYIDDDGNSRDEPIQLAIVGKGVAEISMDNLSENIRLDQTTISLHPLYNALVNVPEDTDPVTVDEIQALMDKTLEVTEMTFATYVVLTDNNVWVGHGLPKNVRYVL